MDLTKQLVEHGETLITEGQAILDAHRRPKSPTRPSRSAGGPVVRVSENQHLVNRRAYAQWRTRSRALLGRAVVRDYFVDFERVSDTPHEDFVDLGLGVLQGFVQDGRQGAWRSHEELVVASVFSDILEMAAHLLETQHYRPAASLIGAVLEIIYADCAGCTTSPSIGGRTASAR